MIELILGSEKPFVVTSWLIAALLSCYCVLKSIYNVWFHPLSHIPGPKLAAMGSFYEFYFDVIRDGTYLWEIEKMHQQYGPIVRINPREVHIRDPQFYGNIYTGGTRKVEKDPSTVAAFAVPSSVAATIPHDIHRSRRGYMNPYFSKRAIVELEPMIHERISRFCERLDDSMRKGAPINLDKAFAAMTADIITSRFYGSHFDYLSTPTFDFPVREAFLGVSMLFNFSRFFPRPVQLLRKLPIPIIGMILPSVAKFLTLQEDIKRNITGTLAANSTTDAEKKSVIVQALGDPRIPSKERGLARLLDEGTVIIFAGTETSARALSVAMFHFARNKNLVAALREELNTLPLVEGNEYVLSQLEPLPYLTGCVKECLRLSFGPVSRLPRVATQDTIDYNGVAVPPGYPVSQSTLLVHRDASIFPDPKTFNPNRWIEAAKEGIVLNNYLCSFTKGSRQCLGISMAHSELYLTIARIVRSYDMDLFDTIEDDVGIHNIRIVGYPKKTAERGAGQGEVKVMVTGKTGF